MASENDFGKPCSGQARLPYFRRRPAGQSPARQQGDSFRWL